MAGYKAWQKNFERYVNKGIKCDLPKLFVICQLLDVSADYILFGRVNDDNNGTLTQEQIEAIRIMKKVFA